MLVCPLALSVLMSPFLPFISRHHLGARHLFELRSDLKKYTSLSSSIRRIFFEFGGEYYYMF